MTYSGFWRDTKVESRNMTIGQYGQNNQVFWVAPQGGLGPLSGYGNAPAGVFASFADLKANLKSRAIIFVSGVVREQFVAPTGVYDVLVVGAANTPRQATDSGTPTGAGATWMAPTSPTALTPLVEVTRQGWTFQNILFNPTTSSAAVRLTTSGGLNEAGQCSFDGCTFLGGGTGQIGIEDNGGSGFVTIENCLFQLLTGTAVLGLTTANAIPLSWLIRNNRFAQNTNDIKMSLSRALIAQNAFLTPGSGATNKVIQTNFLSGQGAANLVTQNVFSNTAAQIANASGYNGSASDIWSSNYCSDAVDFGVPA